MNLKMKDQNTPGNSRQERAKEFISSQMNIVRNVKCKEEGKKKHE